MTPLEKVEALYGDLVGWYGEGPDAETRAAAKLLMVGLAKLREHGGDKWQSLAREYLRIAGEDPARFDRMLESNRGKSRESVGADPHDPGRFIA